MLILFGNKLLLIKIMLFFSIMGVRLAIGLESKDALYSE